MTSPKNRIVKVSLIAQAYRTMSFIRIRLPDFFPNLKFEMIDLKQISCISFAAMALLFVGNASLAQSAKDGKDGKALASKDAMKANSSAGSQGSTSNSVKKPVPSASTNESVSKAATNAKQDKLPSTESKADALGNKSAKPALGSKVDSAPVAVKTTKTSGSVKTSAGAKTKYVSRSSFVPPPPPIVPTLTSPGMMPTVVIGGDLIEYMSAADLKDVQSRTARELAKAQNSLQMHKELLAEKQKRALSFDSLYAEGVVSRRELQLCKKEAADAESELEDSKLLVQELERKSERIETRVKALSKTKVAGSKSSKKTP